MSKVDFHIHTYCSDGELSPEQVVRRFKQKGYEKIAITDHDGTSGVMRAIEEGRRIGITVVKGVEMTTGFLYEELNKIVELHILGYNMDLNFPDFVQANSESMKYRRERNERIFKALEERGTPVSREDVMKEGSGDFAGKPDFVRAFRKNNIEFEDPWEFLDSIKRDRISSQKAIEVIKKAGGIPVLAHPKKIRAIEPSSDEFYTRLEYIISSLKPYGLMGLECFHPSANEEETKKLLKIAEKNGLIISRGSDFHREP